MTVTSLIIGRAPFKRKHRTGLPGLRWTQRIPTNLSEPRGFQLNSNLAGRRTSLGRNAAMMREQQQYRASDYKCLLIDPGHRPETPVRPSMSRNAPIVLAVLLVIGSSGLSASAFARDGGYGAGRLRGAPADGYDGYGNRAGGL